MTDIKVRKIASALLGIFFGLLIYLTVINRLTSLYYKNLLEPFWSYKEILLGNMQYVPEILGNIAMFVPIGFLCAVIFANKKILPVILSGFAFSLCIELCQLLFHKGSFEIDDLFNNTLGAVIGFLLYLLLRKVIDGRKSEKTN